MHVRVLDFLRSFRVNLLAIGVGVLIGLFSKQMGESLKIAGQLYLALLTMTVLPIVFSAITHGVGRLLRSGRFGRNLGYLVVIFVGWVLLGSMLGILVGTVGKAGVDLKAEDSKALGTLLIQDQSPRIHGNPSSAGLSQLLGDVIPHNVFAAFVGGKGLAVVFISILMGISLGTNRSQASDRLLETIRGIYETFFKIMGWVLYGLPFGLCCLTAEHVATVGTTILVVLLKLIVLLYAGCGVLWLIYLFIMRFVTGKSFRTLLLSLKGDWCFRTWPPTVW
jgi:proton glutamate symport protein